jgi:hypothetical protein
LISLLLALSASVAFEMKLSRGSYFLVTVLRRVLQRLHHPIFVFRIAESVTYVRDFRYTMIWLLFQVKTSAEEKLQSREREKYQQFLRDIDKVVVLLLKLSDMLARAENAVKCLPTECCAKEKVRRLSYDRQIVIADVYSSLVY